MNWKYNIGQHLFYFVYYGVLIFGFIGIEDTPKISKISVFVMFFYWCGKNAYGYLVYFNFY
jgi:hypothetical protein